MLEMGGAVAAVENAYMKQPPGRVEHPSHCSRIESGEQVVVGVNAFTETADSPALRRGIEAIHQGRRSAERRADRAARGIPREAECERSRGRAAEPEATPHANGQNVMPPSIRAAHAGVTTGEWSDSTCAAASASTVPRPGWSARRAGHAERRATRRCGERVDALVRRSGARSSYPVGKPGLDGHSNGAEQIAVRARDAGMEVVYEGIRLTPVEIVQSARDEGVHVIGLSILSGSHGVLVHDVLDRLREGGLSIPVVLGGIIPEDDAEALRKAGVRRVYTPKDFDLTRLMDEIVDVVEESNAGV